jgi:hypothetical protein
MKTIQLFIAILALATVALLTGCSGSTPSGKSKVAVKVVFSNASTASSAAATTFTSLGIHSLMLDIIPANPAITVANSSRDLMTESVLSATITLPDPISPKISEPYLFRITAWDATNKIIYCGQQLIEISAGVNPINLTDAVIGSYNVNASDGTKISLTVDAYGKGAGTSSGGSLVSAYLAPTSQGVFDVAIVAKDSATNTLSAYGSGNYNVAAGSGGGSVTDSAGLKPTWAIVKYVTNYSSAVGTYDGSAFASTASTVAVDTFVLAIASNGTVSGTTTNGYVISGQLTSKDNIIFTYSGTSTSGTDVVNWTGSISGSSTVFSGTYSGATSGNGTWSASKRVASAGPTAKSVMQSGLYNARDDWYSTGSTTGQRAYATSRIGLAANGANLAETYTYYDSAARTWSTTPPSGMPTTLYGGTSDYHLTAAGWVIGTVGGGAQDHTVADNVDGTATVTNTISGARANWAVTATDISGQPITSTASTISPWWTILTTAGNFAAGSIRFDSIWTDLNESYNLWGSDVVSGVTSLDLIPSTLPNIYLDSYDAAYSYSVQFVSGGTTVDVYQTNRTTGPPVKIGSGTYAFYTTTAAFGQQRILEITIPANLRTQYKLESNPIYSTVGSVIYRGDHALPGLNYTGGPGNAFNLIAIQQLQTNLSTGGGSTVPAPGNVTATW